MVFQQFNLFPHRSVLDNVTLGPRKLKKLSTEASRDLAMAQQQRVAIARASAGSMFLDAANPLNLC